MPHRDPPIWGQTPNPPVAAQIVNFEPFWGQTPNPPVAAQIVDVAAAK